MSEPTVDPRDLPDFLRERILRQRGGCTCQHPNASPPCSACSTPATADEVMEAEIDWIEEKAEREATLRVLDERDLREAIDAELRDAQASW